VGSVVGLYELKKIFTPAGLRTPDLSSRSLVAARSTLSRLQT